jgi:NADH:ubiquinone oxidoreductase subunit C
MRFIIALKEHQEGLAVIRQLKDDVVAIVKEHTGIDYEGLAQIKDATNKLQAYAHLFNQKAMDAFLELG